MGLFLYESVVFWSGQRKRKEKTSKEKKTLSLSQLIKKKTINIKRFVLFKRCLKVQAQWHV